MARMPSASTSWPIGSLGLDFLRNELAKLLGVRRGRSRVDATPGTAPSSGIGVGSVASAVMVAGLDVAEHDAGAVLETAGPSMR